MDKYVFWIKRIPIMTFAAIVVVWLPFVIDWMNSREALCLLWNTRGIVDAARKGSPSTIPDSHA